MSSFHAQFPDPFLLLSLRPEILAGLAFFLFRALPWTSPEPVERCVRHWIEPYPEGLHDQLSHAMMRAWDVLQREGLLGSRSTAISRFPEHDAFRRRA
jgi:hypothetical protein